MTIYTASLRSLALGVGTGYMWRKPPTGLGVGSYRTSRLGRQFSDGVQPLGGDLLPSREVVFDLQVQGTPADIEAALLALSQAWAPVRSGVLPLSVTLTGDTRTLFGRPIGVEFDIEQMDINIAHARCVFEATDPRMFSASVSSITLGLSSGGGMTFPLTFPLTFGAGSDSDGSAVNAGTFETNWTATIVGPVTTPRITLGATGEVVELDIDVPTGSTLVVSSADGSVLLNGSPRQSSVSLRSRFFALPSGTNTIRFRAASGTGSCTFAWRSASL